MEPPLVSGGREDALRVARDALDASMEPPLVSGGRSKPGAMVFPYVPTGFNGAAAGERRKGAFDAERVPLLKDGLQWSRRW